MMDGGLHPPWIGKVTGDYQIAHPVLSPAKRGLDDPLIPEEQTLGLLRTEIADFHLN